MLKNADQKIVIWSSFFLFLGIGISVIIGVLMIWVGFQTGATVVYTHQRVTEAYSSGYLHGGMSVILGILVIIFGSLISWFTALLLRAFGEMAGNTKAIRTRVESEARVIETVAPVQMQPVAHQVEATLTQFEETPVENAAEETNTPTEDESNSAPSDNKNTSPGEATKDDTQAAE